jgi:hypothetical protein
MNVIAALCQKTQSYMHLRTRGEGLLVIGDIFDPIKAFYSFVLTHMRYTSYK